MSAAATARLRAIVARVATAAGIDPATVTVRLVAGHGEWWVACVDWPISAPPLARRVGASGADAAVDAAARSYAERAAQKAAEWARKADEARRAHETWVAITAAVDGQP